VDLILSVITVHQTTTTPDVLGDTLTEIATEKAGIMRLGGVAVTAPQHPRRWPPCACGRGDRARLYVVGGEGLGPGDGDGNPRRLEDN